MTPEENTRPKKKKKGRWTKWFYLLHWTSGAISLLSILFFAITGVTLNHADEWNIEPEIRQETLTIPTNLLTLLQKQATQPETAILPGKFRQWLADELRFRNPGTEWEWSEFELLGEQSVPGRAAWVAIDLENGELTLEETSRGKIAYVNDLHRGLFTGKVWAGYLDLCAFAICIFSLTGLGLLAIHARRRKSTWILVAAGLLIPLILALFFIHA